jgi:hypothetical protein
LLTPTQVGTNDDWQTCSSFGTRYHILRRKDGSLWELRAPDYGSGIPHTGFPALEFKRLGLQKDIVAFGAGRGGIGVVLTRDGEVWTWGMAFGERPFQDRLWKFYDEAAARFRVKAPWRTPTPITRREPWPLRNVGAGASSGGQK